MSWDDVLDAVEERVRAQEVAIYLHTPMPANPLPVGEGPMPPHVALRALALLEHSRALEAQASEELHRLRAVRHLP